MFHLIDDPSYVVQKMAYQLLKAAARKRTEYCVVEAGVDSEYVVQAVLPVELLHIVLDFGERRRENKVKTSLLGWKLILIRSFSEMM